MSDAGVRSTDRVVLSHSSVSVSAPVAFTPHHALCTPQARKPPWDLLIRQQSVAYLSKNSVTPKLTASHRAETRIGELEVCAVVFQSDSVVRVLMGLGGPVRTGGNSGLRL